MGVVSFMPWPLYPWEAALDTHCMEGWVLWRKENLSLRGTKLWFLAQLS
jgi:hypothetical protein